MLNNRFLNNRGLDHQTTYDFGNSTTQDSI